MINKITFYILIVLSLYIVGLGNLNTLAQSVNERNQIFNNLSEYINQKQEYDRIGWLARSSILQEKGVDVSLFSNQILEDEAFVDYRTDALFLMATQKYSKEPEILTEFVINDYIENQNKLSLGYLNSNITCLSILQGLSAPDYFVNQKIKDNIIQFTNYLLKNNNIFEPEYWIANFDLDSESSQPIETLTKEQKEMLNVTDSISRLCLGLIAFVYYETEDEVYYNILNNALNSDNEMVFHTAKYFLSAEAKQRWKSGRYELFAAERGLMGDRPKPLSKEEMEENRRKSLEAREQVKDKNN